MSEDSQNNQGNLDSIEQPQDTQVFEVNGKTVTIEELQKGYMRQSDYTRKTQELAQQRTQIQEPVGSVNEEVDEATQAIKFIKENGFLTEQDLIERQRRDKLFNSNPELAEKRRVIEDLAKAKGKAPEDVIVEYGFMDEAKLQAAKSRSTVMGMPTPKETPTKKSISEMSSAEYAEFKKNIGGSRGWK